MLTEPELEEIKNLAPKGYFRKVVNRVKWSEKTVSDFFSGKLYKQDIHNALLEVIEEHEANQQRIKERMKALIQ